MTKTAEINGWTCSNVVTFPAETADALEHHAATDLAGILHDAGVRPGDREGALAALADEQVHPLLVSQCLGRAMVILTEVTARSA